MLLMIPVNGVIAQKTRKLQVTTTLLFPNNKIKCTIRYEYIEAKHVNVDQVIDGNIFLTFRGR